MAQGINEPLPLVVARVYCLLIEQIRAGMRAGGHGRLRPAHGFVLNQLRERGEMTVAEIAGFLGVAKQTALELVDELTGWEYVARRRNPRDGRSRLISLTELGRASEVVFLEALAEMEGKWRAEVGPDRLSDVRDALEAYLGTSDVEVALRPTW